MQAVTEQEIRKGLDGIIEYIPMALWTNEDLVVLAQKGSPQEQRTAIRLLVLKNKEGVYKLAHHYKGKVEFEDLVQEGNIGLLRAIHNYDITRRDNVKFWTYATYWVKQAMREAIQQADMINIPEHLNPQIKEVKKVIEKLSQKLGREPTMEEVSKEMGIPREKIEKLLVRFSYHEEFTEETAADWGMGTTRGPEGGTHAVIPQVSSDEEAILIKDLLTHLPRLIKQLSTKEQLVLRMRFGLPPYTREHTLREVALRLNTTPENVRQIQLRAVRKLRQMPEFQEILTAHVRKAITTLRVATVEEFIAWRDSAKIHIADNKIIRLGSNIYRWTVACLAHTFDSDATKAKNVAIKLRALASRYINFEWADFYYLTEHLLPRLKNLKLADIKAADRSEAKGPGVAGRWLDMVMDDIDPTDDKEAAHFLQLCEDLDEVLKPINTKTKIKKLLPNIISAVNRARKPGYREQKLVQKNTGQFEAIIEDIIGDCLVWTAFSTRIVDEEGNRAETSKTIHFDAVAVVVEELEQHIKDIHYHQHNILTPFVEAYVNGLQMATIDFHKEQKSVEAATIGQLAEAIRVITLVSDTKQREEFGKILAISAKILRPIMTSDVKKLYQDLLWAMKK